MILAGMIAWQEVFNNANYQFISARNGIGSRKFVISFVDNELYIFIIRSRII